MFAQTFTATMPYDCLMNCVHFVICIMCFWSLWCLTDITLFSYNHSELVQSSKRSFLYSKEARDAFLEDMEKQDYPHQLVRHFIMMIIMKINANINYFNFSKYCIHLTPFQLVVQNIILTNINSSCSNHISSHTHNPNKQQLLIVSSCCTVSLPHTHNPNKTALVHGIFI